MTKPDFLNWAENLVVLGANREKIENALKQAYEQGYHLGLNLGWAIEQDKEHRHSSDGMSYMSAPPKHKCKDCGEFYEADLG